MVVITPGSGMFNVDRELATIIKQRIVDHGMYVASWTKILRG